MTLEEEWAEQDKLALHRAVKAMLEHKETRRFIAWLLIEGKALGGQPFSGEAPLTTAFNCGEMQMGYKVLELVLAVDASTLTLILKEIEDERRDRTAEQRRRDDDNLRDEFVNNGDDGERLYGDGND